MKPESLINLILRGVDKVNDIVIDRVPELTIFPIKIGQGRETHAEHVYFKFGGMSFKIEERVCTSGRVGCYYNFIAFPDFTQSTEALIQMEDAIRASNSHVIKHHSVRGECPLPTLVDAIKEIVSKHNESEIEKVYEKMFPSISFE